MIPRSFPGPSSRRSEFLAGARDQLPFLLAGVPFGMLFGAAATDAGIPSSAVQGLSLFVFAGGAQFVAAGLIGEATPALVIVLTIAVINLRHALYSASLAPHYARLSPAWKATLAWLLTDEAFATTARRYGQGGGGLAHWYPLGAGLADWAGWQVGTAAGIALGASIPPSEALGFIIPLSFLALLWPTLTDRPSWAAAATAGLLAVALAGLPYRIGLIVASVCGIAVGAFMDARPGPAKGPSG
ncbi:MAG TPA: AzlC family ABC transporter permease [Candidatus Methylomirabilis sp.]